MADHTQITGYIPAVTKNSDLLMAVAVVGILIFMVMPLPTFLLDIFLALNITIALLILIISPLCLKRFKIGPLERIWRSLTYWGIR